MDTPLRVWDDIAGGEAYALFETFALRLSGRVAPAPLGPYRQGAAAYDRLLSGLSGVQVALTEVAIAARGRAITLGAPAAGGDGVARLDGERLAEGSTTLSAGAEGAVADVRYRWAQVGSAWTRVVATLEVRVGASVVAVASFEDDRAAGGLMYGVERATAQAGEDLALGVLASLSLCGAAAGAFPPPLARGLLGAQGMRLRTLGTH